MAFFNPANPILQTKPRDLDLAPLNPSGILCLRWQLGNLTLLNRLYTPVDQAFLLWGLATFSIFTLAQFSTLDWLTQSKLDTALTTLSTTAMLHLTYNWSKQEEVLWLGWAWTILMGSGLALTHLAIVHAWSLVLLNLCAIWLGLCAVGYGMTGWGLRSRAMLVTGMVHGGAIVLLPWFGSWQFLATGLIMGFSLWILAELRWDMRPSLCPPLLLAPIAQSNF